MPATKGRIATETSVSEENAVMNTVAQENLAGVRTVKSFAREPYEIKKFQKHNQKYCDLNMDQARVLMKYDPAISFLTKLMRVLVLLAGGYGVIHGRITLGVLSAFMEYTSKITWPIENVGWLGNCFASAIASNKKLNKILAEEPQIAEPENPVELSKLPGDLEFHHVDFSLHDTPILQDIDFTLKQGHTLGIMVMTGSGKTTIVNLLERFYDVTDGSICLDGVFLADRIVDTVEFFFEADCDACDERKDRHGDECQRQIQFDHTDHCHHDTDQAF